jgi:hypothetical protein
MNLRETIRAATLGRKSTFASKLVKLEGPDGAPLEVEVRAPSVRARGAILRKAGMLAAEKPGGDEKQLLVEHMQVEAVLQLSFIPGTNQRVFEEADREAMLEQPAGGFVDQLAEVALPMLNVSDVERKELEKNSEGTPSA